MSSIDISDSTQRFSDRVENYIRYRPSYPPMIRKLIADKTKPSRDWSIADLGSGTGKLTEILLPLGARMYAVEPNAPMRQAAETLLETHPNFVSIVGTAEDTGLETGSIDLIVAGQAFHWFDPEKTRTESFRILKPKGWIALIWNRRKIESSKFQIDYEKMLKTHCTDYTKVRHQNVDEKVIESYFGNANREEFTLPYAQKFNLEQLKGRLLSSSYTPQSGQPGHDTIIEATEMLFEKYEENGEVAFEYDTQIYLGQLS